MTTAKELLNEFYDHQMGSRLGLFMTRMAEVTMIERVQTDSSTNHLIFVGPTTWRISAEELATRAAIERLDILAIAAKIL